MNDSPLPDDKDLSAIAPIAAVALGLLSHRQVWQKRAREWLTSPAFDEVYADLHHGLIFKILLCLIGSGKRMKMRSARLRAGYRRLATEGELLFASVVIANHRMLDNESCRYPTALVASRSQDVESLVRTVILGEVLAEAHSEGGSETMPQCARIIANDAYTALRRQILPVEETQGMPAALFDVRVSMIELTSAGACPPYIPLLVHPGGGPFAVVPWYVVTGQPAPVKKSPPQTPPPIPSQPPPLPKRPPPLPGPNR